MGKKIEKVTAAKATQLKDKKNGKTKNTKLSSIKKNGTAAKKIKVLSSESDSSDSDSSAPKKANVSDTSDSSNSSASESSASDSSEEESKVKPKNNKLNVKKVSTSSSEEESSSHEGKIKKSKDESSSSESDSSESEEETTSKVNGTNKVKLSKTTSDSSSSEEEEDSEDSGDSDDAQNITNNQEQDSSDSSSSSESESDSDEDKKMVPEKPEVNISISVLNSSKRKIEQDDSNSAKKPKVYENPSETNTIFVGNLSYNVDAEWLRHEFKEAGEIVDVRIASDRDTGRSKGFGYVEFTTAEEASNAMKFLGKEIDGRTINLDFSTPKQSKKDDLQMGTSEVSDTIFVGNLAFNITEDQMWETFGEYGQIVSVRLPTHEDSGGLKGFGYVQFSDIDAAQKAMELHGTKICGRPIRLDFSTGKPQGGNNNSRFGNRNAAANRGAILPPKGNKITF
ncbi:17591_t:CDS:2 [Funneliformis geosporum]|uniref:12077_t:CDS:1 n=1 Tax=Funneliformis geosporum TaxID=1117311 RepID=A0A9W4SET9_9GLOM|nr:12077_t:CDS:2 [Funneliformis geosporum]CAI2170903.1 17591_t:CDS:2 [Funneliformis geosporum]